MSAKNETFVRVINSQEKPLCYHFKKLINRAFIVLVERQDIYLVKGNYKEYPEPYNVYELPKEICEIIFFNKER